MPYMVYPDTECGQTKLQKLQKVTNSLEKPEDQVRTKVLTFHFQWSLKVLLSLFVTRYFYLLLQLILKYLIVKCESKRIKIFKMENGKSQQQQQNNQGNLK